LSDSDKKSVWFISKYCRLPPSAVTYSDNFQVKGAHPARGFSILRALSKSDYDCTLFHARHGLKSLDGERITSREVFNVDGVRVVSLSILPYIKVQSLARILGWIHFEVKLFFMKTNDLPPPDYIVASSLSLLSILNGLILRWRFKSKLIFEVRDVWPLVLIENGGYHRWNPFVLALRLVEWMGYKYSDQIVATMPNLAPHVNKVLGYSRKVHCIPMGISDELLNETKIPLPSDLESQFPENKFIVTYVGSIGVDNALDVFFETVRLLQDNPQVVFRVFGKGDLLKRYMAECSDLDNIFFGGAIPAGMVQSVLERSSLLYFATHPSVVLEYGQSLNKIIDYMYSGRPILASHSGYQSMLNEAHCGYFIPANDADALSTTLYDLSNLSHLELSEIGSRGRDWLFENRRYETLATHYDELFNS
tara:strand:- start:264 stop:1526 length:1263 start_codon:yes stop_codon:yes gene_type:complete